MKKAAIYARKSTADDTRDPEDQSTTRQVENARAYAEKNGWSVVHVFEDKGISGAEFAKRRGLQRLLRAAREERSFSIVVVADSSRLGREMAATLGVIRELAELDVEVYGYLEDRRITPRDTTEKLILSVSSFADEDYRVKTALRVYETAERILRKDPRRVVGGRVFGYRNKYVLDGDGKPTKVVREIDESEAAIVRRIYEAAARGVSLTEIQHQLAADGVPPPHYTPHDGLTPLRVWSKPTIAALLKRPLYRGIVEWGIVKRRTSWGKVAPKKRPDSEVTRGEVTELRIVSEELFDAVATRPKRATGRRPKRGTPSLLAGMARCAECGGGLIRERRKKVSYFCARRRRLGKLGCSNATAYPADALNEAVLHTIEDVISLEVVRRFLANVEVEVDPEKIAKRLAATEKEIKHLTAAIGMGDPPASLLKRLRELEREQEQLGAARKRKPRENKVRSVVKEFRRKIRGSTREARDVLGRLLEGPIKIEADGAFEALARFGEVFTGGIPIGMPEAPSYIERGDRSGHAPTELEAQAEANEKQSKTVSARRYVSTAWAGRPR